MEKIGHIDEDNLYNLIIKSISSNGVTFCFNGDTELYAGAKGLKGLNMGADCFSNLNLKNIEKRKKCPPWILKLNNYIDLDFSKKGLYSDFKICTGKYEVDKNGNVWERTKSSLPETTESNLPSKDTSGYWIFASRKKGKYPKNNKNSGKWLIFVDRTEIDTVWFQIKKATEEGKFGDESKVSTAKPKGANIGYERDRHVICIYTYDWTDEKDVKRIREELRKLGFTNKMPYKADDDTLSGKYKARGDTRISKYYE